MFVLRIIFKELPVFSEFTVLSYKPSATGQRYKAFHYVSRDSTGDTSATASVCWSLLHSLGATDCCSVTKRVKDPFNQKYAMLERCKAASS